jgi:hypothetical protein
VAPTQTHTYTGTHTCIHNTPPGSTPPTLPTQKDCHLSACLRDLLQEPCFQYTTHIWPLHAPRSPDAAPPASPSDMQGSYHHSPLQAHTLRCTCTAFILQDTPSPPWYTRPRVHTCSDTPALPGRSCVPCACLGRDKSLCPRPCMQRPCVCTLAHTCMLTHPLYALAHPLGLSPKFILCQFLSLYPQEAPRPSSRS